MFLWNHPQNEIAALFSDGCTGSDLWLLKILIFVHREDDWAALDHEQEYGLLDSIIRIPGRRLSSTECKCWFFRLFLIADGTQRSLTASAEKMRSNDKSLNLMSRPRIEIFVRAVLTLATISLLLMPSFVLFLVPEHKIVKTVIVTAFAVLFSILIQVSSKAKRYEAVMALAA